VCDGVRQLAAGVDVLVHEALLTSAVSASLLEWNAGARAVGALAADVGAATLVLTHLIPAPESTADAELFVNEVRAGGYAGSTHVARDLLRIRARVDGGPHQV
jgi:ribonuclease Z